MRTVDIIRYGSTPYGTFGHLAVDGSHIGFTVECPWAGNAPNVSCIPLGNYILRPSTYHRGRYVTYEVCDVEGRSRIMFHKGNTMRDVAGCVALGGRLGYVDGLWAVVDSARAFPAFMRAMGDVPEANLNITLQEWK